MLKRFLENEAGTTAIEYALIGTLIAVTIVGALTAVGDSTTLTLNDVSAYL